MTTITQEQAAGLAIAATTHLSGGDAFTNALSALGITIAPPEPPEAMVKLAREIVASVSDLQWHDEIMSGAWDYYHSAKVALAALQYADKVVREASDVSSEFRRIPGAFCRRDEIRRKLGAL